MENKNNYQNVMDTLHDLIAVGSYNQALSLCKNKEYINVPDIQAERLYILVKKLGRTNEAYKTWKKYQDYDNVNIVMIGMDILARLKKFDTALEYVEKYNYDDIRYIRRKIRLLINAKEYAKALEICEDKKFANDEIVKQQKDEIYRIEKKQIKDEVSDILAKIYADSISLDEIKNSQTDSLCKSVLILAYYEKHNYKSGIKFIKDIKKLGNLSSEYLNVYNRIYQRIISNKNKYFDVEFYAKLLNREVNNELITELQAKKEEKHPEIVVNIQTPIKKKESTNFSTKPSVKRIAKYAEIIGTRVNSRYNNVNKSTNTNNAKQHTVLIKDVLSTELNELGQYLYVMMQLPDSRKNAIKAWDNLENMAYKPVSDKETLRRLLNIILKVSVEHPEIVDADSKKFVKLLEK